MKEDPEDEINIPIQLVINFRMRLHTVIVFLKIMYSICCKLPTLLHIHVYGCFIADSGTSTWF